MTTPTQPIADDAGVDDFPTLEQLRGHNAPSWLVSPQGEAGHMNPTNTRFVRAAADPKRGYVAVIEENRRLRRLLWDYSDACYEKPFSSYEVKQAHFEVLLSKAGISPSPLVRSEADAKEGGAA